MSSITGTVRRMALLFPPKNHRAKAGPAVRQMLFCTLVIPIFILWQT